MLILNISDLCCRPIAPWLSFAIFFSVNITVLSILRYMYFKWNSMVPYRTIPCNVACSTFDSPVFGGIHISNTEFIRK